VVAPLAALDGSTFYLDGGHVVSVFPFLEGEELRSREALFRQELPALLARLHRHAQEWPVTEQRPGVPSLRDRNWDKNDWWDWSLVERSASLVRAFDELRAWVADADDQMDPPPLHDDALEVDAQDGCLGRVPLHSTNCHGSTRGSTACSVPASDPLS
jgi:Ser/Thr protein kinase RdoA (MazF antagonist)